MRGTRWLLLVAIAVVLGSVGLTYRAQRKALRVQSPQRPQPLPVDLNSSAEHWRHQVTDHGRVQADIDAEDVRQVKDSSRVDLRNVTLKFHNKDGETYNLVKSDAASFFPDQRLYSEGEVEITLKLPREGQPAHAPVSIRSSGVSFDTTVFRAETDRPASFIFEHGDGQAVGASYDPTTHQLLMKRDAQVRWRSPGPNARPMKIEAASLTYHEATSEIWLMPWGRLTRDNTVTEGENVVIHLQDEAIRKIEATKAHGTDSYPDRKLQYAADQVWMDFDDDGEVRKITAQGNARLVSVSESTETTITAYHVDMDFDTANSQSALAQVFASGDAAVEAKPLSGDSQPGETHILRSEVIEMKMRPGGRNIESVATRAPGRLEFLPNLPVQHHRILNGNDLLIAYGPLNRVDSFRATQVKTETDPTAEERKRNRTRSFTTSRALLARFDPKTNRMAAMEQSGDFTYDEGDRKARAAKATLDSGQNVILLETAAHVWDPSGATSADHIRMDQRTGDFTAEGGVKSSRLPDRDQKKNSQMLSGDEPLEAQARRMDSSNHNRTLHYEGNAVMWQGANRIQADVIDVDREKSTLAARGNVVTYLWEEPKGTGKKQPGAPVLTVVHAPRLDYAESNRLATYTGGATLNRPALQVKSGELRAFLADSGADSRLEKAFADGAAQIVQTSRDVTRTGTGEHAEYYTDDQKVILRGGRPKLVETPGNTTEGDELTYYANDDRLLVNGAPRQPGKSRIIRKRK